MEVYFAILDSENVVELCRFRTSNHKLPIEIGRWNNTNRSNRICTHCNKNELGDEQRTVIYISKHLSYCSNTLVYIYFDLVQRMGNLKYSEVHHRVHFYYSAYKFCYFY
jgi:hypothetical protein